MTVATIAPSELAQRKQAGQPLDLIDIRTPVEFREVHVEFARNVPLDGGFKLQLQQRRRKRG